MRKLAIILGSVALMAGCTTQAKNATTSTSQASVAPKGFQSQFNFPQATCGDKPTGDSDTWYPVFVDGGDLETLRRNFCADASFTVRKDSLVESVQLASFTNRDRAIEFATAVGGDVGQPTYPNVASSSPAPQAVRVGFDQELDQFQNAYSRLGFGDDQNAFDYQVDLSPKDSDQSCKVIGWRMPDEKTLRGVTVSIKQWTPTCSQALKLAMTNLTPTLNYDKLYPRISSPEFVREVDGVEGGVVLGDEGDTKLEVIWIDDNSYCPIGQCNLSFQFQLKDTTELSANTSPSVSSVESEPITITPEALLTANDPDSQIRLHDTPSFAGRDLGYGLVGDRVFIIERTSSDGYTWYKVRFPRSGAVGWIREDFVSVVTASQPDSEPQTYSSSPDATYTAQVVATSGGSCNSPDALDSRGHRCGGRAASVRSGGGGGRRRR